jgi:hypothetical protein
MYVPNAHLLDRIITSERLKSESYYPRHLCLDKAPIRSHCYTRLTTGDTLLTALAADPTHPVGHLR